MKIEHFEDLDCWKRAREVVRELYKLTRKSSFASDFGLRDQIQRAGVSIMANIAEGFGTKSDPEFVRFLSIAIRSALEVTSHLYVALDVAYISKDEFDNVMALTNDCINLCKGFIRYLKS